ncbi:hypothetical protein EZJ49_13105 [Bdellovibrio bacteriovorus]|uniref:hypothetical protein n=1 Tax=Bdellovibrio bacteriovorus TaxID=959 RepID=UPI0021D007B3|nr:hypothetical protein [Bdellovibrio bacteriovorus]UXR64002.1 hypothetical protein EZJ49_13105 [Bdellovibrio bacteriovorus]
MKWLSLILPFFLGFGHKPNKPRKSLKETALEIYDAITIRSRAAVFLSMAGLCAIAFICGGFFMFLLEATRQYDRAGMIFWNSTLITSSVLVLLAVGGLSYVYFMAWPGVRAARNRQEVREEEERHQHEHPVGSLEQALAALVMDFVKERESKREHRAHTPPSAAPEPAHSYTSRPDPETASETPTSYH